MSLRDIFQRNRAKQLDTEPEEGGDSELMAGNDAVRKKQLLYLGCGGAVALVLGSWYVMGDDAKLKPVGTDGKEVKITTDDMVNRNMSQREWQAASEAQMQSINNQLKGVDGQRAQMEQLQAQIAALQGEKQSMASDGQRVMSAYQQENDQLRQQIAQRNAAPVAPAPTQMYGPGQPNYRTPGAPMTAGEAAAAAVSQSRSIKLVSFEGGPSGTATRISGGTTSYTDSPNYLPPNSIAKAKVIVGVDASAGVQSQTDPLPVILRITGPARSVYQNGKLLTTRIEGCVINGAARGDLSSEKVYVKLQRMTCPQANGRFAVSDVKGFISFAGKTGVRGRVVSREGGLVTQAFIAGIAGGFGRGFSANTDMLLQGTNVTVNGKRQQLGIGDIAQAGIGNGVAQSADMVSKYLIERAEQYQPIIEMPTGIDVEIVFLEGVFIQN
ncbi:MULTISPECIES: TraB/VirB10 family protein [Sphingomonas]|jgi:conjugal transfer pilus assembly protein TraB|uniref:TraB/VirB10 family protein n=1 Tax=Sphingomonas TaxID=13687 RepID=UPI0007D9DFB7|nr:MULTISPECIES: TrbI/VirB10 family protein [Sphingomonas]OAN63068.1 conjugal transfer protein TraB [Sphingomonas sp. TDK1]WCP73828.1 TrbI/VirB10 family protein [Sphingomonas hankookensis]